MPVSYPRRGRASGRCRWQQRPGRPGDCPGLTAAAVDASVAEHVLGALTPAALALHIQAIDDTERERGELDRPRQRRPERARYEA